MSNSQQVFSQVPTEDLAAQVEPSSEQLSVHKALGVIWDASTDGLKVRVNVKWKLYTRRGLLSMVSQTYDPLGIIQPFVLQARQLFQQACLSQLGWDDNVTNFPGMELDWRIGYAAYLIGLKKLMCPARCTLPRDKATRVKIHTFLTLV